MSKIDKKIFDPYWASDLWHDFCQVSYTRELSAFLTSLSFELPTERGVLRADKALYLRWDRSVCKEMRVQRFTLWDFKGNSQLSIYMKSILHETNSLLNSSNIEKNKKSTFFLKTKSFLELQIIFYEKKEESLYTVN